MSVVLAAKKRRNWILIGALGLASTVGVAACANRVGDEAKVEQHQARDYRGPVSVVADVALDRAALTDEQSSAIEAIADRAKMARHDRSALKQELRVSASEVVRHGTADSDQFDDAVDLAMSALESRIEITSTALAELHGLLDADQRAAVAEGLREHIDARFAASERRHKKREGFKRITAHLMLTGVQVDELKKIKKELLKDKKGLRPTKAELGEMVDAFEGDDFVSAMNEFHAEKLAIVRAHVAKAGGHADTVLSLLDAEQREVLAELIELGPEAVGLKKAR